MTTAHPPEPDREARREAARRRLGIGASDQRGATATLRQTFTADRLKWYPLVALGLLTVVDTFQSYAFTVLAPEISDTLGIGRGAITGLVAAKTVAIALAPLPIAALTQRTSRRALLSIATGIAWSLVAIATGFVVLVWGLLIVVVLDGLTTGSTQSLHQPLLLDSYPASTRVRVLSAYQGANAAGNVLAPLGVALLAGAMGFTWRGVFVTFGLVSFATVLLSIRLRDPGFGHFDEERIRSVVDEDLAGSPAEGETELGFFEIVRRIMLVPTVRRLLLSQAVLGVLLVPYQTFLFFFLEERWGLGPGGRGLFFAGTAAASIGALAVFGRSAEARFQADPGALLRLAGALLAVAVTLVCLGGLVPWFAVMLVLFASGGAIVALLLPAIYTVLFSVIPSQMRPHAAALAGIFLGGVGGVAGALFLSGIDRRFGVTGALVALLVPGLVGALVLGTSGKLVAHDLDRMIDGVLEDEDTRAAVSRGDHLPLLACRGLDFSYGQVQVLFDVDFTVDEGEMVALLGVNGAGKSTLLRAISGLGLPSGGSIRWRGSDITFLDAERRVPLGISQVPGGRAVFGPLSVVDNLRGYAHTLHRSRADVDRGLDRCFETFPRLAERRNQAASTLSGGEQQMLGLSKALLLQPRLLLIDELSLGLAPIVVEQLLTLVRDINAGGTAVVLVEQSVNIALNLVDHAYFMEKGEIRFDGAAPDLLARDDLLRAVFLEGAGAHT